MGYKLDKMKFYKLNWPNEKEKYADCTIDEPTNYKVIECSVCNDIWAAERISPLYVRFETNWTDLMKGDNQLWIEEYQSTRLADFHWPVPEVIVSKRVKETFIAANIIGGEFEPVVISEVAGKGAHKLNKDKLQYWALRITGSAGKAHKKSGFRIDKEFTCNACGHIDYVKKSKGLYIDESRWDGSDVFTVEERPAYALVGERVKKLIEEKGFTNVVAIPNEEINGDE